MDIFSVFTLCGGLAFFLYGMTVMSKSLEKMAGGKLERMLKRMTSSPFKSLLLGAGISAAAIRRIRESLPQARAFHMSGKITVESPMSYRKGDVSMGLPGFDEYTLWRTDPENLRAARKELME